VYSLLLHLQISTMLFNFSYFSSKIKFYKHYDLFKKIILFTKKIFIVLYDTTIIIALIHGETDA